MAIGDPTLAYRSPVRIALGTGTPAFTFSGSFPYGGTALGVVKDAVVQNKRARGKIPDTAKGSVIGAWADRDDWEARWSFLQLDADALGLVFKLVSGAVRGATPGVLAAGKPILLAPYDVTQLHTLLFNPFVFANGPMPSDPRQLLHVPIECWAARDANDHDVQIDAFANLSLT